MISNKTDASIKLEPRLKHEIVFTDSDKFVNSTGYSPHAMCQIVLSFHVSP